ncbi:hypothetical protein A2U01_0038346, partial [Trifolium medium]|nr:hypothetical protein [Trifolium medium]
QQIFAIDGLIDKLRDIHKFDRSMIRPSREDLSPNTMLSLICESTTFLILLSLRAFF